jgi:hypothetical protein
MAAFRSTDPLFGRGSLFGRREGGVRPCVRGRETSPRRDPRRVKTPVRRRPYSMTIVWILVVIILVLLVIALARRVL